ncbi:hypothetical protein BDA99DRAFT_526987 [Phascolomyces articulosus]|uniref:Uncharacterized protein n=1 Tax=Phascolomyces articulosus TaxID=60185 RepID=A0AAD5JN47_9FUNG|nr:hypothetical protein BDA99DRAFT_526987 [Phascolomyces articulosus]
MYRLTLFLFITSCFLLSLTRAIETTSLPFAPNPSPTGVICIQVVCPDPGVDDPNYCPERCNGNCKTIQNACCPQSQVAVCADDPTSAISPPASSGPSPTASVPSDSASSPATSSSSSPVIASSPAPAETTNASPNPEEGGASKYGLKNTHYFVVPLFIILVTKLLLL